ncbi:MAG TPA: cobyrinate a,c-diamide synthase, partial [Hyphomicrobiales bacterium]|nr:cobyrinate a,c-diamide synthase [Hyphomicrobiales bacterium]
ARIGMPVFGCIPRRDAVQLPERHLGLVQSREAGDLDARLEALADLIEASVNIDALLKLSICHSAQSPQAGNDWKSFFGPPAQRIAIAQDDAFSFVYPHLLKAWREAGAELLPFSPLADEAPNKAADMVWLPGGYPELHAGRLAVSANFMAGLRSFASTKPVHGECGGYMVLGDGLVDARGERHAMLGLLRLETSFSSKKLHLGYRRAEILSGCVLGPQGTMLSGHEFHYATIAAEAGESLFAMSDSCGASLAGGSLRHGNVTGSFFHIIDKW